MVGWVLKRLHLGAASRSELEWSTMIPVEGQAVVVACY